jgi:glycosyltransferase involved in cell wall biosynthesis
VPASSVSVIVPVRNEAGFIETCVRALLEQRDLPPRYEVLVVDGESDDGTRDVLARLAAADPRVRVLDNPRRIVPTALNLGIAASSGEVVIRVDGHTKVAPDFVRENLALLAEHPEAWSVGGPIAHRGVTRFARAVAAAMSSRAGVGGARHRFEQYEGYAESTAFPAFRRWVFDRVGLFDEALVRNQDDELNFRITEAGGKIFISPRVKHDYFVRGSASALFRQYMQYGYWKVEVMRKHGKVMAPRHLVPAAFVIALPVCAAGAALLPPPASWLAAAPLVAYGALLGTLAAQTLVRERDPLVAAGASAAAALMHVGYGLGTLAGALAPPARGGRLAEAMRRITR